mmetsp:Transcript_15782/g.31456  ORF Transcript_15782/g.31456 Transcript_15782/m.31456 type:complete len:374 (+) Transcript_15782:1272-2393(+)
MQRNIIHKGSHEFEEPFFVQIGTHHHGRSRAQMDARPKGGANARKDDRHAVSGIICVLRNAVERQHRVQSVGGVFSPQWFGRSPELPRRKPGVQQPGVRFRKEDPLEPAPRVVREDAPQIVRVVLLLRPHPGHPRRAAPDRDGGPLAPRPRGILGACRHPLDLVVIDDGEVAPRTGVGEASASGRAVVVVVRRGHAEGGVPGQNPAAVREDLPQHRAPPPRAFGVFRVAGTAVDGGRGEGGGHRQHKITAALALCGRRVDQSDELLHVRSEAGDREGESAAAEIERTCAYGIGGEAGGDRRRQAGEIGACVLHGGVANHEGIQCGSDVQAEAARGDKKNEEGRARSPPVSGWRGRVLHGRRDRKGLFPTVETR